MSGASVDVRVASNGRPILPRSVREAMGLTGDTKVHATVEGDVVRLDPLGQRVRRAQELYRAAVKTPRPTEDFLRDRRAEADADADKGGGGRTGDGNGGASRSWDWRYWSYGRDDRPGIRSA
jgi:bifunctional DNA-binding transcriptional regulator/antitoxin component of YhaV-PrlF toxin-antitoxin module